MTIDLGGKVMQSGANMKKGGVLLRGVFKHATLASN